MRARRIGLVLAGTTAVAFALLSLGAPRLLWVNTGLRVDYSWRPGAAALLAAAAAALFAVLASRRLLRALGAVAAASGLLLGAARLVYRLDAGEGGLVERGLLGSTSIPWRDVARVDSGPGDLVVTTTSGALVRVGTREWDPESVAQLERTIARRVREATR